MTEREEVEGIPVVWREPDGPAAGAALWLTHLGGSTEQTLPMLEKLAGAGFVAVSFDPPGHGLRGSGDPWAFAGSVLSSFRQRMWPLLGRTTLESLRVLDWTQRRFDVGGGPVVAGGVSMGGDVSVALAGADERVSRVSALIATPDWARPRMRRFDDPGLLVDQGTADAYARWYYERLDPMTHLDAYRRDVAISFHNGGADFHVPADDALRFRQALLRLQPDAERRVEVHVHAGAGHMDVDDRFYDAAVDWLTQRR